MQDQNGRIRKFSKVLYILAKIAFIILIIVGVSAIFAWIFTLTDSLTIFKIGNVTVKLPIMILGDDSLDVPYANEFFVNFGFDHIAGIILNIIVLKFALSILRPLKEGATPFSRDIVVRIKKLAIVLLISGFFVDGSAFIGAGVAGMFYLVLDSCCNEEESKELK